MKYTLSILTLLASMLIFSACSDDQVYSSEADVITNEFNNLAEKRAPAPGDQTIADIVVASTEADEPEFTLLLDALEYTGLTGVFAGEDQYTVFGPTDQAFLDLVSDLGVDPNNPFEEIDDELGKGTVANVLLYHVTEGRRAANSVVPPNARKDRTIETLLEDATFMVNSEAEIEDVGNTALGNEVNIISPNNSAKNGIIHVIDKVLLPIVP